MVHLWDIRTSAKLATIPVYEAVEGVVALPAGEAAAAFPGVAQAVQAVHTTPGKGGKGAAAQRCVFFATAGDKGRVRLWRSDTATCIYEEVR